MAQNENIPWQINLSVNINGSERLTVCIFQKRQYYCVIVRNKYFILLAFLPTRNH